MNKLSILFGGGLLFLAGCSSPTITVSSYNPTTGTREPKTFSNYFWGTTDLIANKVGAELLIEQDRRNIPILEDLIKPIRWGYSESTGYSVPEDFYASTTYRLCVYNHTDEVIEFDLRSAKNSGRPLRNSESQVIIGPKNWREIVLGRMREGYPSTEDHATISYKIGAVEETKTLRAPRLTLDEVNIVPIKCKR